jgi:hypothetical protein
MNREIKQKITKVTKVEEKILLLNFSANFAALCLESLS